MLGETLLGTPWEDHTFRFTVDSVPGRLILTTFQQRADLSSLEFLYFTMRFLQNFFTKWHEQIGELAVRPTKLGTDPLIGSRAGPVLITMPQIAHLVKKEFELAGEIENGHAEKRQA